MDVLDSQVHLGPGGAAEMVAAMDALGIASVLIDEWWMGTPGHPFYAVGESGGGGRQALRTTSPTAELAAWTYPGRFSYLVRVDPRDPELSAVVRLVRDADHARALRLSPGMSRAEMADFAGGIYDPVFQLAAENGLPVFLQIGGHADQLDRIVRRYPASRLIICHCGMPPGETLAPIIAQMEGLADSVDYWGKIAAEPKDQAFAKVLRLAEHPQIALKWAHAPGMFGAAGYPNAAARPFLRKALDSFGAERVMWASDITANQTGETWAELLFAIRDNSDLMQEEREQVLGRTARTWLDWRA